MQDYMTKTVQHQKRLLEKVAHLLLMVSLLQDLVYPLDRIENKMTSRLMQNRIQLVQAMTKLLLVFPGGDLCIFSEASVEVPITCEINSTNTGSQNSSKRSLASKTSDATKKQSARKLTRIFMVAFVRIF